MRRLPFHSHTDGCDFSLKCNIRPPGYWDDLTPCDGGSACVCGRGDDEPLAAEDLCFVQCDSCGWWLHGGCCGFVPAAEGEEGEEGDRTFTCVVCSCITLLNDPKVCGTTEMRVLLGYVRCIMLIQISALFPLISGLGLYSR